MAAGVNAEVAWNCGFAACTGMLGLRTLYISMGGSPSVWTGLHSFLFFPDMYFASRNGGLLGFSGNQRTGDKSGGHRLQILPWRR